MAPRRPPDASSLGPPLDLLRHLWQLNHALERMSSQMRQRLGVTAQQRLFVRCIGKYPGITAAELSALLHLDPGTVSVGLARLARKGLVTRRRDDRDQRRVALRLTPAGRRLNHPDRATVEFVVQRVISRESAADLKRTKRLLEQLAVALLQQLETSAARRSPRAARLTSPRS